MFKAAQKSIDCSKASVIHVLVTLPNLLIELVYVSQKGSFGKTLIPTPHVCEEQKVKLCDFNGQFCFL